MRILLLCLTLFALPAHALVAQDDSSDKITLNVRDTSLGQVIELISVQQSVNIVAGVDTNLPVTVNFFDAELDDALDWVLGPLGLGWYFDGKVYTILEASQIDLIKRPLIERILYPNYLSAAEIQTYLVKFLSPYGSIVMSETPAVGIESGADTTGGLSSTIQEMLIVIDNEESMRRIERVFRELDRRPRQVLVEATMVQVTLDETNRSAPLSLSGDTCSDTYG